MAKGGRTILDKIFPDHWSFMLGEIALYSFIILLATGVFLTLYFVPSSTDVIYHGGLPARCAAVRMSEAYASSLDISFAVRGGLVIRQMHHWAADIFVGAIVVHMARDLLHRRLPQAPRAELVHRDHAADPGHLRRDSSATRCPTTWSRAPASASPTRSCCRSRWSGSYLASFLFGGNFPGNGLIIPRFFILHVLIIPLVILGLIGAHLGLLVRQKHTQFKGPGRTEDNVVGTPMFPIFIAKTTGFLFIVAGVYGALGAFVQINPIWLFGPYEATRISYAVQPDWYMGWLDGALRIMPSWEFSGFGHTIPFEVFLPGVLFPGLSFNFFYLWPFIESRVTGNRKAHNLLDRPRDRPLHTAFGATGLAFYFMLFAASSTDVLANFTQISLNTVLWFFRFAVFVIPIIVGFVTWSICREMSGLHGIGKRKRAVVVTRSADGEYATVVSPPRPGDGHAELDPEPVPAFIEPEPTSVGAGEGPGVRRIPRD